MLFSVVCMMRVILLHQVDIYQLPFLKSVQALTFRWILLRVTETHFKRLLQGQEIWASAAS